MGVAHNDFIEFRIFDTVITTKSLFSISYQQAVGKSVSWQLYSPVGGSRIISVACIAARTGQVGPRPFDRCIVLLQ